ncbi:MAG: ion transporter [Treponema sp.]|nr:ion transporter [Candidatus Treponema equifaecale]
MKHTTYEILKFRTFEIIEKGKKGDYVSKIFDLSIMFLIILNIFSIYLETMQIPEHIKQQLSRFETLSVVIFTIEYVLRVWTATVPRPRMKPAKARLKYMFSFMAMVDLLAILPWYLPFVVVLDLRVLRTLRLMRLFRIFKFNRYTSALERILNVLKKKSPELLSSVFVIMILMLISSILMYTIENPVQPEVFSNGFSGFWWAVATFTTVGYGDIYPITVAGKILGAFMALLGIGVVAVPTGIVSSGFVEQVTNERRKVSSRKNDFNYAPGNHEHVTGQNNIKYKFCPFCGEKLEE